MAVLPISKQVLKEAALAVNAQRKNVRAQLARTVDLVDREALEARIFRMDEEIADLELGLTVLNGGAL